MPPSSTIPAAIDLLALLLFFFLLNLLTNLLVLIIGYLYGLMKYNSSGLNASKHNNNGALSLV